MAKRKIEVISGCPLCEKPVVELVKKMACTSCDTVILRSMPQIKDAQTTNVAIRQRYGITRAPAIVLNGNLRDCCKTGTVSEQALRTAGVGST